MFKEKDFNDEKCLSLLSDIATHRDFIISNVNHRPFDCDS